MGLNGHLLVVVCGLSDNDSQVHSAVLLTGHVNPWTSYFHSGIVFSSSCVLPWIYLVFAMYLTRCETDLCGVQA